MILIQPDRLARTCACPDDRREFLEFPLVWLRRWIYRFQAVQLKQIFSNAAFSYRQVEVFILLETSTVYSS